METQQVERCSPDLEGCWFDGNRGIYIGEAVQECAKSYGWPGEVILFDWTAERPEDYYEAWIEAEAWLDAHIAPEGYWFGNSEGGGDFGLWKIKDE